MLVVCWVLKLTGNIVVDCAKVVAIRSAILVLTNKMCSLKDTVTGFEILVLKSVLNDVFG